MNVSTKECNICYYGYLLKTEFSGCTECIRDRYCLEYGYIADYLNEKCVC